MAQFSHSLGPASILMCKYTDVRGATGSERRLFLDMCHHVSTFFSFWGEHKLIRLSCSYNYFCFPPLSRPGLSHRLTLSPGLAVDPWGRDATMPISGVCSRESVPVWDSIHFSNWSKGIKLNPAVLALRSIWLLECAVWWTDPTAHFLSTICVYAFFRCRQLFFSNLLF